jgi:hypothetical protein
LRAVRRYSSAIDNAALTRRDSMYEIIDNSTAERREFIVRNTDTGRNIRAHRFYDDALAHLRRLINSRVSRLSSARA